LLARLQNLRPKSYTAIRAIGAIWILIEWTAFFLLAVAVTILVFTENEPDPEAIDETMSVIDWIDAGTFVLVSGAIGVLTLALGIGMLTTLDGDARSWESSLLKALAVANIVAAIYWAIAWTDWETIGFDITLMLGLVATAAVSLIVSYARRAPAS
jgi:hypothetical protein